MTKRIVKAAAIYARISQDRGGEAMGVERQRELCGKLAAEKGWPVVETYIDNDVSAYSGRRRPEYERMLTDLESGAVDAVLTVDLDRLTRRPAELEDFILLADQKRIALANVSGDVDLGTSEGRFKARIVGSVARMESEKKSERLKREREHAARNGERRGGRRPFGYEPDGTTIRIEEAELVRESVRRVLAGETVRSVAVDWSGRGIVATQTGRAWTSTSLRHMLRNPRIAGLRRYRPRDSYNRVESEAIFPAKWPAIIDRETFERLVAKLKSSPRGRPPTRLLAGIATCGRCGQKMWTSVRHDEGHTRHRYSCRRNPGTDGCGRLAIACSAVDEIVAEAVLQALAGPALAKALTEATDSNAEPDIAALGELEARLEDLARDFADGAISRAEWMAARDRLNERLAVARRSFDRPSAVLAGLPTTEEALRDAWKAGSVEWRRAILRAVLDKVIIHPAPVRGRFDAERIELVLRG